ncbi:MULTISPECIES: VOC family protein [unclassified Nocardioides]|uniref:VOC family protein n=1 Tax=unclassified Nocardioides TaxID=2615069 RepID=UPI0006F92495|nr:MULTISPECIES: VOC family protein [unclassified Nocardioides]KRA32480.1 glyoxalase-like domain protein [Nocardioides sp. Root614]KRA89134.1 glyoxalase-like domain protein [Nocardioides sp. Root682]
MFLENVVFDATAPQALGRFWEAALGTERLTDVAEGFETRLAVPDGPVLDLCFQRVPDQPVEPQRLHLDLYGGAEQAAVVERLISLGASPADVGQGDVPWVVLTDPAGNAFCVLEERSSYDGTGPVAGLTLQVADAERDVEFWEWLTGWVPVRGSGLMSLRHPSLYGPLLELSAEAGPKGAAKNRTHLDVRLEPGDDEDEVARGITEHGGRELQFDWGELPWRHFADPSGNEFCVLRASTH